MNKRGRPPRHVTNMTRQNIVRAAEGIIAEAGPDALRLQDIANQVDIRVPTIYSHFADGRDGVLRAVGDRYVAGLAEQFAYSGKEDPERALLRGTRMLVRHLAGNPSHVKLSLVDLGHAGGVDFLVEASGGDAVQSLKRGPLSAMYERLDRILADGRKADAFRQFYAVRFLRQVMGAVLTSLTWPGHIALGSGPAAEKEVRKIERETVDLVQRLVLS